jgi:predicted DsbA family dithiol-disulfide isomerase
MSNPPAQFRIDVVSDVVCPWCFIGKRRLEAAIAEWRRGDPQAGFTVNWHPFQLNPDLPPEGVDRRAYLEAKFGGPERAAAIYDRVRAAGRTADIAFEFDRIARQPNTLDAHRLVSWAQARRDAGDLVEALFRAYFLDGRYVGDRAVLAAIAGEAGFDAAAARSMLDSDALAAEMTAMDRRVRELGVTGVPFFILNDRIAVEGAQEPATLVAAFAEALTAPAEAGTGP